MFSMEVDLVAEMTVINPFDFFLEPYAEKIPFRLRGVADRELAPYLERRAGQPASGRICADSRPARARRRWTSWWRSISGCSTTSDT